MLPQGSKPDGKGISSYYIQPAAEGNSAMDDLQAATRPKPGNTVESTSTPHGAAEGEQPLLVKRKPLAVGVFLPWHVPAQKSQQNALLCSVGFPACCLPWMLHKQPVYSV